MVEVLVARTAQDREVVGVDPRLAALVILVGLGCGLVGALYLLVLHLLQHVLWPTTWSRPAGFAILGGVGLVIGLLPRLIGEAGDVELMSTTFTSPVQPVA